MALQGGSWERDPFGIGPIGPNLRTGGRVYPGGGGGERSERGATMAPPRGAADTGPLAGTGHIVKPAGGAAEGHYTGAERAGLMMGEPTSLRGGAGAPTPVGVIRGTTQTFAAPTGGPQLEEFATPLQARQAFNLHQRGQYLAKAYPEGERAGLTYPKGTTPEEQATKQFGEWRPWGQTGEEVKARASGVEELRKAQAGAYGEYTTEKAEQDKKKRAEAEGAKFDKWIHGSQYATFDPGTKQMGFAPSNEDQARDHLAARNVAMDQGSDAGRQHFEERQMIRKWLLTQRLPADFNVNAFLDDASLNPEHWQGLVNDARKVATTTRPSAAPEAPFARAAEMGEGAGLPPPGTTPSLLGPKWGKPLGGAAFVQ